MIFITTVLSVFLSLITTIQTGSPITSSQAHLPIIHPLKESREFLGKANQISLNPYFRLPTVKGRQTSQPDQTKTTKAAKNQSKKLVQYPNNVVKTTINQFNPILPFKTNSFWHNSNSGLSWQVGNNIHNFSVKNGQFVSKPGDTWFVYGLFGPLKAILKPNNVKYPVWGDRHNGVDFTARYGLAVYAAESGTVGYTGPFQGHTIIIKHSGGYQTTYGHLSTINVTAGQRVKKGQFIGRVGNSGTLNPHLHFEIDRWQGNTCYAINPLKFINLNGIITPQCLANQFYSGSQNPYSQPDFAWNNPMKL